VSESPQQLRVALYARVSTDEQREGQTIQSQIAELERFVAEKTWTVVGTYLDDGWSGSILVRPSLDRMRDDGGKGLFDAVIVNDVDRLARDVAHLGVIKRDLERKRVQLVFRKLPAENSPTYNLMVNILGSFAEFERELIVDRTRRGRRHKVEVRKQYVGCEAPFGYRYRTESSRGGAEADLKVVPEHARIVRDIYEWALTEGLSMEKIARRLTEAGTLTPSGKRVWAVCSISKILHNEMYSGIWCYGKSESCEPKATRSQNQYRRKTKTSRRPKPRTDWLTVSLPAHLVIVPRPLWVRVQDRIDQNPKFSPRNTKYRYLLRGFLRCEYCSGLVTAALCRSNGRAYCYYYCGRRCKESKWMRREPIESSVWDSLRAALLDPDRLVERARLAAVRVARNVSKEADHKQATQFVRKFDDEEGRLIQEYRTEKLSAVRLGQELDRIDKKRAIAKAQLALEQPDPREAIQVTSSLQQTCAHIVRSLATLDFDQRREVLRRLIVSASLGRNQVHIRARVALADPQFRNTVPAGAAGSSAVASPPLRESRGNLGTFEFDVVVNLPTH